MAWIAAPGCLIIVALLALAGYTLYYFLRPSNNTVGEVSGELVQNEALIDFDLEVDLDLDIHGDRCWTAIAVLAVIILLILMAVAIFPRLKEQRLKKKILPKRSSPFSSPPWPNRTRSRRPTLRRNWLS